MTTIPSDGRIFFTGSGGDIPTDWLRDTAFDDRYTQGITSGTPGTNGGSTGHVHTADALTHVENSHTHTLFAQTATVSAVLRRHGSGVPFASLDGHTHPDIQSDGTVGTYQAETITVASSSAIPSSRFVIVLKPDPDLTLNIPVDGIILGDYDFSDSNFKITDGASGTTDLDTYFLRTAVASGAGGGIDPDAGDHTHTSPAHAPLHNTHVHADSDFGASQELMAPTVSGVSFTGTSSTTHHRAENIQATAASSQTATVTINASASEPAFTSLLGFQNRGAASSAAPIGTIIPYIGTIASITSPWVLCDGANGTLDLDTQIKVTKTVSIVGNKGGTNSHTHTGDPHSHTQDAHGHSFTFQIINTQGFTSSTDSGAARTDHSHVPLTGTNLRQKVATTKSSETTMQGGDGRYQFRNVAFIQLRGTVTVHVKGGAILGGDIK